MDFIDVNTRWNGYGHMPIPAGGVRNFIADVAGNAALHSSYYFTEVGTAVNDHGGIVNCAVGLYCGGRERISE